jgi:pimeloyl-ACP methyl ester carboxylesterase
MIQGVGAQGLGLNPLVAILRKQFTCATFDNRGIGASQPVGRPLTVPQMARDVLALMDHLDWTSAHIVGHSFGGLIAMQTALTARPRVRSLSLLCSFPRGSDVTRLTLALLWRSIRLKVGTRNMRRRAFMDLVLPPAQSRTWSDDTAELLRATLGHDLADAPEITNQQVGAMRHHDVTPQLNRLSGIPTLVINGEYDILAPPSSGRAIADGIGGSRYIEIPGASHAFPVLEPERCSALVLEHMQKAEIGARVS